MIALQRNIFGEVIAQYRAPHDGIVIGKSVNPVAQTGARILNLGHIAPADSRLIYAQKDIEVKTGMSAPSLDKLAGQ